MREADHSPQLVLRLRMSLSIPPFLYAFMSCKEATLSSVNAVMFVSHQTLIGAKGGIRQAVE